MSSITPKPGMTVEISMQGIEKSRLDAIEAAESMRKANEAERAEAEFMRKEGETGRITAEQERTMEEDARNLAESGRILAEESRVTDENLRSNGEQSRAEAEKGRSIAESGRANAEQQRVESEEMRENAEAARVTAEAARANAEALRQQTFVTNEANRQAAFDSAETQRASEWTEIKSDVESSVGSAVASASAATDAANTAAENANAAAEKSVRYDVAQTLSDAQKAQARGNIDAADAESVDALKSDISQVEVFIEHSVVTGEMVTASDGQYTSSASYNAHEYLVYGLSVIYLTPYFTNATYGYAFYDKSKRFIANSGGTYDVATRTEITVPNGAYYIRFTENTYYPKPKLEADFGLLLETKADIAETKANSSKLYADVYKITNYIPTDGLAVVGKYYDINGTLQLASNISTTGIIEVPFGIKDIYYNAYRNTNIPTMLFFDADMQIVGTVIATVEPVYGDVYYSGYAEIPSTAKYMEASMVNTIEGQIITVRYSKVDNNLERIKKLEKDPLFGLKITCTGNSITSAVHSVPGHGYVEQIADAHGMTVDNHAIWGAIIPQGHPRASGDVTDIGCIHDTLDSMDADADIIIMSGSINDCEYYSDASFLGEITGDFSSELDLTTFYGALEDMCKKALQKWAGKPIIYVIEHRMTLDNTQYGQYYLKLHEAIVKVMNKWGISIVDLFTNCPSLNYNDGYKAQYTTGDGTHPNYEGYEKFYVPRVYAEIKKLLGI